MNQLQKRLTEIISRFPQSRVVVIGDLIADQFIYGEISRVSREAPVFILKHERTETLPGGAANCAMNLASLGVYTSLVGTIGEDETGGELLKRLKDSNIDCSGVVSLPDTRTTTKVRILAGQTHSTRQQVIRIDYEQDKPPTPTSRALILEHIEQKLSKADSTIISDYNYGIVDDETIEYLRSLIDRSKLITLVDSRFRLSKFIGFTSATPNEDEVEQLTGKRLEETTNIEEAGRELLETLSLKALLITRGKNGMMLMEEDLSPLHIEPVGSREPVDVTGAGDTVIATYAAALASGASYREAAYLANHAGGIVVMKRGTAAVSTAELLTSISS
jgi:D-glycero-beta-D-manno-heptose-7-phosphate kinase